MNEDRVLKIFRGAYYFALALLASTVLFEAVGDPDYFWHLKTGEWFVNNVSILSNDPFSYTTGKVTPFAKTILNGYWLSQILIYSTYNWVGFVSVYVLRVLSLVVIAYTLLKREQDKTPLSYSLNIVLLTGLFAAYYFERPQGASFVLFAVLLWLFARLKRHDGERFCIWSVVAIPATMLLWANMHGGYMVGQIVLTVYLLVESLKYFSGYWRPLQFNRYRMLVSACVLGLLFSFVNPNGLENLKVLVFMIDSPKWRYQYNFEFQNIYTCLIAARNSYTLPLYLSAFVAFLPLYVLAKKRDVSELVIVLGCLVYSCLYIRYLPFYVLAVLPYLGQSLFFLKTKKYRLLSLAIALVVLISPSVSIRKHVNNFHEITRRGWISEFKYPAKAAKFIEERHVPGKMFNALKWGGYLIWRLGPERPVFVDGRMLNESVYKDSFVDYFPNEEFMGRRAWQIVFDKYGIDYALVPQRTDDGHPFPLAVSLSADHGWMEVFRADNSIIFLKRR